MTRKPASVVNASAREGVETPAQQEKPTNDCALFPFPLRSGSRFKQPRSDYTTSQTPGKWGKGRFHLEEERYGGPRQAQCVPPRSGEPDLPYIVVSDPTGASAGRTTALPPGPGARPLPTG